MNDRLVSPPDAPVLVVKTQGSDQTLRAGSHYRVGRDPQSDIVINDSRVSWRHAVLRVNRDAWILEDSGSTNGTFLGTRRIGKVEIGQSCILRLGHPDDGPVMMCSVNRPAAGGAGSTALNTGMSSVDRRPTSVRRAPTRLLRIGRAPENDLVVPDLSVSRVHAELRNLGGGRYEIADLGSHNGTFVNGQRITRATTVTEQDLIGIGRATFRLVGDELREFIDEGDVSFVAQDLTVRLPGGKVLLDHVSFPIPERSLVGVIGPSGAGKSTLLGALTGTRPATEGAVLYDNRDLYTHYAELRHRIGLVPQDNILHDQLKPKRALRYAAELRFPGDTIPVGTERRVDEVIDELSLTAHCNTRTAAMSGGQQKRVNVALELLTKPSLLFLDEPTSGLDPGLDKSVMELMSGLAKDGRTVIIVTHSVINLDVCDRLLVLVPGGRVAFYGPPGDGLRYFGKAGWAEVFQSFEAEPDRDWAGDFRRSPYYAEHVAGGLAQQVTDGTRQSPGRPPAPRGALAQISTLCRRYLSVIASDRSYLILLGVLPLVIGALLRAVPAPEGLAGKPGTNGGASTVSSGPDHRGLLHRGGQLGSRARQGTARSTPENEPPGSRPAPTCSPSSSSWGSSAGCRRWCWWCWACRAADARPRLADQVAAAGGDRPRHHPAVGGLDGAGAAHLLDRQHLREGHAAAGFAGHRAGHPVRRGAAAQREDRAEPAVLDRAVPVGIRVHRLHRQAERDLAPGQRAP